MTAGDMVTPNGDLKVKQPNRSKKRRSYRKPSKYVYPSYVITQEFRDLLLAEYPALRDGKDEALLYRRIMGYILYQPYKPDANLAIILFPRYVMAELLECTESNTLLLEKLEEFSQNVLPLTIINSRYKRHLATEVIPEIPAYISAARDKDLRLRRSGIPVQCVSLDYGLPVSLPQQASRISNYSRELSQSIARTIPAIPNGHPAQELVGYLNSHSGTRLVQILKATHADLVQAHQHMRDVSEMEREERDSAIRLIAALGTPNPSRYSIKELTPRIYPVGANANYLPRELRKLALGLNNPTYPEVVSLDMCWCGVAIASRLWGDAYFTELDRQNELTEYLDQDGSLWLRLLHECKLAPELKEQVKTTIHSLSYGMYKSNATAQLAFGSEERWLNAKIKSQRKLLELAKSDSERLEYHRELEVLNETRLAVKAKVKRRVKHGEFNDGIGLAQARAVITHPFVANLIAARNHAQNQVIRRGGVQDAWGNIVPWDNRKPNSLLCYQVQSYELRMMVQMLPLLIQDPEIEVLSWLHDGVTLYLPMDGKRGSKIESICRVVNAEAQRLGIKSHLDVEI